MIISDRLMKVLSIILSLPPDTVIETVSREKIAHWDSLVHMNLVLALEEEFGVVISDDEILQITSFQLIYQLLDKKLK